MTNGEISDHQETGAETPSGPIEPPKGALKIIFLIVFMDLLGFGIIIPLLPLYAKQYQASSFDVGLLFSIYSACQFVASPILGALSDRYGRRPVLVFSQLGSAVGYLLLGLVMNVHALSAAIALMLIYLSRIIDGLSGGNISTAQAYISDVTPADKRAKGMAIIGAAFGLGFALGPGLSGFLALISPALPGYAAAIMSTIAMLMTYFRLPESRFHKPTDATDWLHPRRFAPIFRHGRLVQLLFIGFISMAGFVMLESMMALFLNSDKTFSYKGWQVALYFAYLGVIIAVVQGGCIGKLTKRFGEWPLAIIGPLFVGIGMALIVVVGFTPMLWLLLIGGAINAIGRSLQTPTLYALISHNSDPKEQGLVFGLNQGLASIARIIGPLIASGAFILRIYGPFATACVIALIASIWTWFLRRTVKDDAPFDQPAESAAAQSM